MKSDYGLRKLLAHLMRLENAESKMRARSFIPSARATNAAATATAAGLVRSMRTKSWLPAANVCAESWFQFFFFSFCSLCMLQYYLKRVQVYNFQTKRQKFQFIFTLFIIFLDDFVWKTIQSFSLSIFHLVLWANFSICVHFNLFFRDSRKKLHEIHWKVVIIASD